jgi:hypothetical protein
MHPGPPPLFPDWFSRRAIDEHFEIVDSRPSVLITTLSYHITIEDLDRLSSLRQPGTALTVIYTLDDLLRPAAGGWDRSPEWEAAVRSFALSADLLAGPQLPRTAELGRILPLPHGPVVPMARTRQPSTARGTDLYFSGAWYPYHARPADSRSREFRAYLIDLLRQKLDGAALEFGRVHFWRTNPLAPGEPLTGKINKPRLLAKHAQAIDGAKISLAPAGYGYYTTRHSDILARGGVMLTERIHRKIHLPDHERWEHAELALFYDPAADDIADVVTAALSDVRRLDEIAEAGQAYARQHLSPRRQVRALAGAIRATTGLS